MIYLKLIRCWFGVYITRHPISSTRSDDILALRAVVQAPDEVSVSCAGLSLYLLRPSPVSFNTLLCDDSQEQYS